MDYMYLIAIRTDVIKVHFLNTNNVDILSDVHVCPHAKFDPSQVVSCLLQKSLLL